MIIRPADPRDAAQLVALAEAVGSEPEGWLISDSRWRSVGDERRYLRAVRKHPDAAVFVAELDDRIIGRLSVARDPHPASRHVADLVRGQIARGHRVGIIADSTTVNFYKAMRAALNLRPDRRRVVLDRDNFPTNRYVVESLARDLDLELVWLQAAPGSGITVDDVAGAIDERTAVVTLSHVAYHSGYLADCKAITDIAHQAGALVVWDLCHSVGSTEIALDDWDVDFAVGCTYKFVGAGPGAPALCYVNARHHDDIDQPIWGWLGRRDSFEMEQGYLPAPGVRAMLSGTPPLLGVLAVREGAAVIAEAGIAAIRAKAVALTEMVVSLTDEWLLPQGFSLGSPRQAERRGAHVSINRSDARAVCARLVEAGVLADFRTPSTIRIGLSPLPASFTEVWDAVDTIRALTVR